jgi:hypothetical protein
MVALEAKEPDAVVVVLDRRTAPPVAIGANRVPGFPVREIHGSFSVTT